MGAICDKTSLPDDCDNYHYFTTLTSIDINHDFDLLQLLQHASGSDIYLSVRTNGTNWLIGDTINGKSGFIKSASAGTVSPASPSNSVNKRLGQTSWQYGDANGWHDGDIRVVSIPRT